MENQRSKVIDRMMKVPAIIDVSTTYRSIEQYQRRFGGKSTYKKKTKQMLMLILRKTFLLNIFGGFLWGHCCSALGFKAITGPSLACFIACTRWILLETSLISKHVLQKYEKSFTGRIQISVLHQHFLKRAFSISQ